MYIVKPQKGFVIPVEYISNDKLYDESITDFRYEEVEQIEKIKADVVEENVYDRLFDEDEDIYSEKHNDNFITAILEKKQGREESNTGFLVFDDEDNDIEIDQTNSIKLDNARENLRKAIEVEIEKVGKLVLDDSEIEINSKATVKSADAQMDYSNTEDLEENIVTDEPRGENEHESIEEPALDTSGEDEAVEEPSENE